MTHDELLWAINSVAKQQPCDTVGHWSCAKALRAVVELHKPSENDSWGSVVCVTCPTWEYPCPTIQAIEKELG